MELKLDKCIYESSTKKIYQEDNYLIKVFEKSVSKANVLNEALNNARAEETNLNVPSLVEITKVGEKWAIIYEYVHGVTLDSIMKKHPDKIEMYLQYFVNLQVKTFAQNSYLFNRLREKITRKVSKVSELSSDANYYLLERLNTLPIQNRLCHGDFIPTNVVITKDNKPYIIDWSHASQGNGAADIANTYLLLTIQYGNKIAERYLSLIMEKSEYNRDMIDRWLPIVAASNVSTETDEKIKRFYIRFAETVKMK